jgi:Ca-activated chloride channel family protein
VSFSSPLALLALLVVPAVVALALLLDRRRARYPVAYTNLELLAGLVSGRRRARRLLPLALLCVALACAAVAFAHPSRSVTEPQQNATIVLLVDVSGSMRASDVAPTRLLAAVAAMHTFLALLPSQFKVGLVAFSDTPQPLLAPTLDRQAVSAAVGYLQPEAGTAIGDGLAAAVGMVQQSLTIGGYVRTPGHDVPGAIVLLSDGAQNRGLLAPYSAALEARKAGIRVYPVSLGTPNGTVSFGYGAFTNLVPVPPDPVTMHLIAQTTGGRSYTAQTASSVVGIYRSLGSSIGRVSQRVQIGSWFEAAAALCLLGAVAAAALVEAPVP